VDGHAYGGSDGPVGGAGAERELDELGLRHRHALVTDDGRLRERRTGELGKGRGRVVIEPGLQVEVADVLCRPGERAHFNVVKRTCGNAGELHRERAIAVIEDGSRPDVVAAVEK